MLGSRVGFWMRERSKETLGAWWTFTIIKPEER